MGKEMKIPQKQQLNLMWVFMSLLALYYGAMGSNQRFFNSLFLIVAVFLLIVYFNHEPKVEENLVVGKAAEGQWGR